MNAINFKGSIEEGKLNVSELGKKANYLVGKNVQLKFQNGESELLGILEENGIKIPTGELISFKDIDNCDVILSIASNVVNSNPFDKRYQIGAQPGDLDT